MVLSRRFCSVSLLAALAAAGCAQSPATTLTVNEVPSASPAAPSASPVAKAPAAQPATLPAYSVTSNHPTPGLVCFTLNDANRQKPSWLLVTDEAGRQLYSKQLPDRGFNFQQHHAPDGTLRYSYMQTEGPQLGAVSTGLGTIRLMDGDFHELAQLSLLPHGDHGALPADLHEFVYLDDHHYILTSYENKRVTNVPTMAGKPSQVAAAIIQEVQDGRVVFEWDSSTVPAFYDNASDGNDYTNASTAIADYMHMNAVCIDPRDQNLVVSFRHQDQLIKLDRHTGRIMWRLGGKDGDFPLGAGQPFSHQHFARVADDGSISLFDNGNATSRTRLLTFHLDEATHSVTGFASVEPESRYSFAMGSYQKLANGGAFIGWGAKDEGHSDASELGPDGTTTFSLTFEDPSYESYRALKYPR
jgi:hypothetical protein